MSSKTKTISQSRIVETNSSGIVTIIIDDDLDSNAPKVGQSVITGRPVLAVRPPLFEQSPKFASSDHFIDNNEHQIVIQEKKKNIILVNSSLKSAFDSPIINGNPCFASSSSSTRVSCIASQPLSTEVKSHHNHVSKNQAHYVVVNKPNRSLPNSTVTTSSNSSPSSLSKQSSSPTKYRLWQPSNQSFSRSPQLRPSVRTKESKALPPEDTESDCMDDQTFFKYLNLIPENEYKNKPQIDLKSNWSLRNIARITKPETNSEGKILLPNLKLIRTDIKVLPDMTQKFAQRKMDWYRNAQQYNYRLQKFKADLPQNPSLRDNRTQIELEKLHKELMAEKQRQNEEEDRYRKVKSIENRKLLQLDEQKQELEFYTNAFEWTSLMGQRVRDSTNDKGLSAEVVFYKNRKIEDNCSHRDILSVNVAQSSKSSTRITRSNTGFAGIDRMWGPRSESHEYCFNRKQRLEKYKRLETGLDWKSRIIAMQCKPVDIEVTKVTRCPCCLELVEPEWGHSCHDSDSESNQVEIMSVNDSESGLQSENNFNEEEVISITSEIITAGNVVCYECGSEECKGDCFEDVTTPVTKISITDTPILVFASNQTIVPLKPKIEDKMMVQKVPVLHESNVQRIVDQKSRFNNERMDFNVNRNDEESDDDIVIVKEVQRDSQCRNQEKSLTEPVIIRYPNPSELRPTLKRKFSEPKQYHSPRSTSSDIIIRKCK